MGKVVYFKFKSIDDTLKFIEESKKMLESFIYSLKVLEDGTVLRINIEGTRTNIIWEVQGKCFYMN